MFNMAITKHAILLAALLASGVAGQDPSKMPKFAYPPNGSSKVFNLLDTVMVTYTAFYDTGTLYTFCEPGKGKLSESGPSPRSLCAWEGKVKADSIQFTSKRPPGLQRRWRCSSTSHRRRRAGLISGRARTGSMGRTARHLV